VNYDPSLPDERVNVSDTHPVREALVLVAGVAGLGVALIAVIALTVELLVPRITPGLEAWLFSGARLGAAFGPDTGVADDPRAEGLAQLLERLERHWPDKPYELSVAIFEESAPNALAFPGGLILVTSGLLDQVESENELAFVLAHELGHFRNRDHLRGIGRGVAFALVIGVLGLGGSGGAAQLAAAAGGLAARSFDRDQESEADRFGLEVVQAEYGHVAGASEFFERLPEPGSSIERQIVHYLATHPLSRERIEALRKLARDRGWSQLENTVPLEAD
jgi:predicted Zn-dependent protease